MKSQNESIEKCERVETLEDLKSIANCTYLRLSDNILVKVAGGISLNGGSGAAEAIIRDVHCDVRGLIAKYLHAYEYVSLNAVDSDLVRAERYIDKKKYLFAIRELEGAIYELRDVEDSKCPILINELHEAIKILKKL